MPNRYRYSWTFYKMPELYENYLKKISLLPSFAYTIAQVEECPKTKRHHIQGYTEFHESTPIAVMRSVLVGISSDACQVSSGNQKQNITYCSKTDSQILPPIVFGVPLPNQQGKRTDINLTIALVKKTQSMKKVLMSGPSYLAIRMSEKYLQYMETPRPIMHNKLKFIWIHGKTGTGKTRYVYENYINVFRPVTYKWWESYDGDKTVLIDDFRKDFCKFHELLTLTDIYPFRVQTKGGSRQIQYDTIIFTSPIAPADMWIHREDINQLLRRITQTIKM